MDFHNHFEVRGSGPALILLHGNGEDHTYFRHQLDALSARFTVYAPDTRGHGATPRGDGPFTIARFAEDLYAFMAEQRLERAHILGFSDGGNIALVFALRHPEKVDKLILNGANISPAGVRFSVQLPIELGYRLAKRSARKKPEAAANAELLGLMVNDPMIPPETLETLRCPVLVIAGTRDMIRRRHTELIASRIPGAQLVFLPGSHFIAAESPGAFNAAVLDFLG